MMDPARKVSWRDVCGHLAAGAGLGAFLALSLIVGNATILAAILHAADPGLSVLFFVLGTASVIAVGSAISGFILTSLERNCG